MSLPGRSFESALWKLLERRKSFVIMQAKLFRQSEILTFARQKDSAEILVDHLQNWIDGILPLIAEHGGLLGSDLGIYLTEFWPSLQFAIFSILGGAYFDAVRNLRFSLESVLIALADYGEGENRPSYYRIIESLPMFSEAEKTRLKALHGKLSLLSHPSREHLQRLLDEPGRAFTLFYDPELFAECCSFVDEVAGAIFSIILEIYPEIKAKATGERYFYSSLKRLPMAAERI